MSFAGLCSYWLGISCNRSEPRSVEPLNVPEGSQVGDRVTFDGAQACTPDEKLNPKKKIWEKLQVMAYSHMSRHVTILKRVGGALAGLLLSVKVCNLTWHGGAIATSPGFYHPFAVGRNLPSFVSVCLCLFWHCIASVRKYKRCGSKSECDLSC